jgi:hypothetical protein
MHDDLLIHTGDIVACRRLHDNRFNLKQPRDQRFVSLDGPLRRAIAEIRAINLADEFGADAWIEEAPGQLRCLT